MIIVESGSTTFLSAVQLENAYLPTVSKFGTYSEMSNLSRPVHPENA